MFLKLQISEWMNQKGVCKFRPSTWACCAAGFDRQAEEYFNNLEESVNCCVRQLQTEKSLDHLLLRLFITISPIMCLYTNVGQHEKFPGVVAEMKENNVSPDNLIQLQNLHQLLWCVVWSWRSREGFERDGVTASHCHGLEYLCCCCWSVHKGGPNKQGDWCLKDVGRQVGYGK